MNKENEVLFLDFVKAKAVCKLCRAKRLNDRKLQDKNKIIEEIASGKINIFILNHCMPKYTECMCTLTHFDKPCMKDCVCKELNGSLQDTHLWSLLDA